MHDLYMLKTITGKIISFVQLTRACIGVSLMFTGIATLWFPIYSLILNIVMINNDLNIKYINYVTLYLLGFTVGAFIKVVQEHISSKSPCDSSMFVTSIYGMTTVTALLTYIFKFIKPSTAYLLSQYEIIVHRMLKYSISTTSRFTIAVLVLLILVALFSSLFMELFHVEELVFNFCIFIAITFGVYFCIWILASITGKSVYIM